MDDVRRPVAVSSKDEGEGDIHLAVLDRLDTGHARRRLPQALHGARGCLREAARTGCGSLRRVTRGWLGALRGFGSAGASRLARAGAALRSAARVACVSTSGALDRAAGSFTNIAHAARVPIAGACWSVDATFRAIAGHGSRRVGALRVAAARAGRVVACDAWRALAALRRTPAGGLRVGHAVSAMLTAIASSVVQRLAATCFAVCQVLRSGTFRAGTIVVVLLGMFGWLQSPPSALRQQRNEAVLHAASARGHVATSATPARHLREVAQALRDPSVADDAKLAAVAEIADDPHDAVTHVLLSAAGSESLLVSMASIRALRGRPCERLAASLGQQLSRGDWQRRAWAAKVLGENGCGAAAPDLRRGLARERDGRVRRQLSAALAMLGAHAAR